MDRDTLIEKVATLHRTNRHLSNYVQHLHRQQQHYRGQVTPAQLKAMRRILKGHTIDAARAVDFYPPAFITPDGRIDEPALVWWLDHTRARWEP